MLIADRDARLCGLAYLVVVITGIVSLAWIPSQLDLGRDPAHMLAAINAKQTLYRIGVAAGILNQLAFLALGGCFYHALRQTRPGVALAMLALVLASVPIGFSGAIHQLVALDWATDAERLADDSLRSALVAQALQSARNTILVVQAFWGLWLLPLALLLWRARLVPAPLSLLLGLGCAGYLVAVFGDVLLPAYDHSGLARVATVPAGLGEIGTCLWLLLAGARWQRRNR